jgi:hypothetical protein
VDNFDHVSRSGMAAQAAQGRHFSPTLGSPDERRRYMTRIVGRGPAKPNRLHRASSEALAFPRSASNADACPWKPHLLLPSLGNCISVPSLVPAVWIITLGEAHSA